jgi:hypothetical protein
LPPSAGGRASRWTKAWPPPTAGISSTRRGARADRSRRCDGPPAANDSDPARPVPSTCQKHGSRRGRVRCADRPTPRSRSGSGRWSHGCGPGRAQPPRPGPRSRSSPRREEGVQQVGGQAWPIEGPIAAFHPYRAGRELKSNRRQERRRDRRQVKLKRSDLRAEFTGEIDRLEPQQPALGTQDGEAPQPRPAPD